VSALHSFWRQELSENRPPDLGIAHMRHYFDQLNPNRRAAGIGPTGEISSAISSATASGADIVMTTFPGGPPSSTTVSYGGGRTMSQASLYPIFWGDAWKNPPAGFPTIDNVLNDIAAMAASPYLTGLSQYIPGIPVARLEQAYFVDGYNPPGSFTSVDTDYIAWYMMAYGPIPEALDTVVCVMMPPGITHPGLNGEHSFTIVPNLNTIPVLWVLYRSRAGISCTFSHELVETMTDPDGTGVQINPRGITNWNEIGMHVITSARRPMVLPCSLIGQTNRRHA
jgi:hypothetical protein